MKVKENTLRRSPLINCTTRCSIERDADPPDTRIVKCLNTKLRIIVRSQVSSLYSTCTKYFRDGLVSMTTRLEILHLFLVLQLHPCPGKDEITRSTSILSPRLLAHMLFGTFLNNEGACYDRCGLWSILMYSVDKGLSTEKSKTSKILCFVVSSAL